MKRACFILPLILISAFAAVVANGAPVKIEFPQETTAFKYATGSEIANGQCLTCHSVEYVSTQPPMPRTFWAGSVKKMQEKYGAQIPPEQVEAVVDYLTRNYGAGTNSAATTTPGSAENGGAKPASASASDGPKLAIKYGCLTCHNVSIKIVGPAYREIAAKYKTDPDATAKVEEQIHKGGSGKWGSIIMPPFPQVSPEEMKVLTEWILRPK
jgi:cytochrome c551/c552